MALWEVKIDRMKWGGWSVCVWMMLVHISHLTSTHTPFHFSAAVRELVLVFIFTLNWTHFSIRNEHFHFLNYACWWHSISSPTLRLFPLLFCALLRFHVEEWSHERLTLTLDSRCDFRHHIPLYAKRVGCWKCQWIFDEGSRQHISSVHWSCRQTFTLNSSKKLSDSDDDISNGIRISLYKVYCMWMTRSMPANSRKYFN